MIMELGVIGKQFNNDLGNKIKNSRIWARSIVVKLGSGDIKYNTEAVLSVNLQGSMFANKPEFVAVVPQTFSGFGYYLYDDNRNSKSTIIIQLHIDGATFSSGLQIRFSIFACEY